MAATIGLVTAIIPWINHAWTPERAARQGPPTRATEDEVRRTLLVSAVALPLCGCGWFGGHKEQAAAPAAADPSLSSDQILQKDCSDEQWKQQNLGLWYSVCRQPMKW